MTTIHGTLHPTVDEGAVLGNTEHGLGSGLAHGSIAMLDQTDPAGPVLALNGLTLTTPKKPGQVPQRLIEGLGAEKTSSAYQHRSKVFEQIKEKNH
eukprot:4252782-Amphidinium_carterae.1